MYCILSIRAVCDFKSDDRFNAAFKLKEDHLALHLLLPSVCFVRIKLKSFLSVMLRVLKGTRSLQHHQERQRSEKGRKTCKGWWIKIKRWRWWCGQRHFNDPFNRSIFSCKRSHYIGWKVRKCARYQERNNRLKLCWFCIAVPHQSMSVIGLS